MKFVIKREKLIDGRWRISVWHEADFMVYGAEHDATATAKLLHSALAVGGRNDVILKVEEQPTFDDFSGIRNGETVAVQN